MMLDLRISSPDGQRVSVSLNGRHHCEASLPIQQEWLIQALFAAARRAGLDPHALIAHANIIPFSPPPLRAKGEKAKRPARNLTLKDLGL